VNETQAILERYRRLAADGTPAALATVVRVEGSSYRRPGARMLVPQTGQATGTLSAGCLERDVAERAAEVVRTGRPTVVTYDTTTDDDIVWGLGLGCNGVVRVLIEPATGERMADLARFLEACSGGARPGAAATVYDREGDPDAEVGARALLFPDGTVAGDLDRSDLLDDLRAAARTGEPADRRYRTPDGHLDVFVEIVEPRVPLVVFGAGHDALPVVTLARSLGWHTTVVDTRARAATRERFADADAVVLCRPDEVGAHVTLSESTVAVLMTHNYLEDLEVLRTLVASPARYVGCLGPGRRTERLLGELGLEASGRIYGPVGLDIGAETPEEIALSIVAEIRAVLAGRDGGSLRDREGAIHGVTAISAARGSGRAG
jgi:xanthine dehydrogenase accessory factor